jgi:hypothetical protein
MKLNLRSGYGFASMRDFGTWSGYGFAQIGQNQTKTKPWQP